MDCSVRGSNSRSFVTPNYNFGCNCETNVLPLHQPSWSVLQLRMLISNNTDKFGEVGGENGKVRVVAEWIGKEGVNEGKRERASKPLALPIQDARVYITVYRLLLMETRRMLWQDLESSLGSSTIRRALALRTQEPPLGSKQFNSMLAYRHFLVTISLPRTNVLSFNNFVHYDGSSNKTNCLLVLILLPNSIWDSIKSTGMVLGPACKLASALEGLCSSFFTTWTFGCHCWRWGQILLYLLTRSFLLLICAIKVARTLKIWERKSKSCCQKELGYI